MTATTPMRRRLQTRIAHTEIRPVSDMPVSGRPLRGIHVLMIALGAFAVILTANLTMVFSATGSFPGVVSKNSYVASQEFNMAAAERARLGWELSVGYEDGILALDARDAAGAPLADLTVAAEIGLAVDARTDRSLALTRVGDAYLAPIDLPAGQWRVKIEAVAPSGERMGGATTFFVR